MVDEAVESETGFYVRRARAMDNNLPRRIHLEHVEDVILVCRLVTKHFACGEIDDGGCLSALGCATRSIASATRSLDPQHSHRHPLLPRQFNVGARTQNPCNSATTNFIHPISHLLANHNCPALSCQSLSKLVECEFWEPRL